MATSVSQLSDYELKRLERIKENQKMLEELFPEGTDILLSEERTPEKDPSSSSSSPSSSSSSRIQRTSLSRRMLMMSVRRNPSRKARPPYSDSPRRVTRSMSRSSEGSEGLMDGIKDEQDMKRIVYQTRPRSRKHHETEALPIELDNRPACSLSATRRIVYKSSEKVYDKINGTTCHQCRQKTIDRKTVCHNKNCNGVRGQFCAPCLKNRYGEDIVDALRSAEWVCPPCRGVCNCSFCLPKKGRPPTGIMIHLAREAGFDSVREYLEKSDYNY